MTNLNNIRFLPLDIPYVKCDSNKITEFMDNESTIVDYEATKEINNPWKHVIIRSPLIKRNRELIPGSGWRKDFSLLFPEVVQAVESLPYMKISYVYLFEQHIDVTPHLDSIGGGKNKFLEPAAYRINLLMEDTETFYLCDNVECTSYTHLKFPENTNTWVFSNKKFKHGSNLPKHGKRKILLIIGNGILDSEKHMDLLLRSYNKYKNFVIR
jgi:hypothetical protein